MLGITRGTAKKIFAGKTDKNQCTAWVNFDGTTTPPTIRDSFNVSSVVRNAVGNYTITFNTAMINVNYSVCAGGGYNNNGDGFDCDIFENLVTNTGFSIRTVNSNSTSALDYKLVNLHIFGGK